MSVKWLAVVVLATTALTVAGCAGGSNVGSAELQPGTYEYELTTEHLSETSNLRPQVERESEKHTVTLGIGGGFGDTWTTSEGKSGACYGTYEEGDSKRVTFRWSTGCFGDWSMTYSVDGDTVRWSDVAALPPAAAEDQTITEIFNSVPWTRVVE